MIDMRIKYYSEHFPRNLFNLIPKNCHIYLDVGCAAGLLGKALKERSENVEVYGVEINPEYAQRAEKYLDGVVCGDVEEIDLGAINKKFDCIIYADILEHLQDPWTTLRKHKVVLSQEGVIVLSIPNVQFIAVILSLLFGNWNYKEVGILDKTHLRFFTKKTIKRLLHDTGFEIQIIRPNYSDHKALALILKSCSIFGFLTNYFARQFLVVAKKKHS